MMSPWSTGLCDCFSDIQSCCLTSWCPCVAFGRITNILDKGTSSCVFCGAVYTLLALPGVSCLFSWVYRSKLREQYSLEQSPCMDLAVHCCCEFCAICQEYRELQIQGFDMSIGWDKNVEKRNLVAGSVVFSVEAPTVEGHMTR